MAWPDYVVMFRGRRACPCLAEWLVWYERMLLHYGVIKHNIDIAQLIGGAAASAGTHTRGGAYDIWQRTVLAIWIARQMGAMAWARGAPFAPHQHGVLKGCPHNGPARYQIDAGEDGYSGLGAGGRGSRDNGPRDVLWPLRTWKQGIEWAKQQLEEDDVDAEEFWRWDGIEAPDGSKDNPTWQAQSALTVVLRNSVKMEKRIGVLEGKLDAILAAVGGDAPQEPDPEPEPEPEPEPVDAYIVKQGDTVSGIAKALGIKDWHDLAQWNGLKSPYTIEIGDKLKVTAPEGSSSPKG